MFFVVHLEGRNREKDHRPSPPPSFFFSFEKMLHESIDKASVDIVQENPLAELCVYYQQMFAGMDFLSFEGAQSWWHIIDKKRSVEWMKRFDKWHTQDWF